MGLLLALIALAPSRPATGQQPSLPKVCGQLAFSTEEDFITHGPAPPDGNPYISDGDLLGDGCIVCARNADLLMPFDVVGDLGLDAADVIDPANYLVAFSTELDSSNEGQFTAGDLLIAPYGAAIPNVALTNPFQIGHDIGLDGLQFMGAAENIEAFLAAIVEGQLDRAYWLQNPGELAPLLEEYQIDIWYSTEGTWAPSAVTAFLDGDVLSARDGVVVAGIQDLLPTDVPAGVPQRGVDFGLDGVANSRLGDSRTVRFSTEILYENERAFTDGDVLLAGNGVVYKNEILVRCFEPGADFLGLDAFHLTPVEGLAESVYVPAILKALRHTMR
jgi:hypothetical protein